MAEKIIHFTDLIAWQKAHQFALEVYKTSANFPATEQYALSNQLRRAVVSVTSNIAEGFNRKSVADKNHFYQMAIGSCSEVQSQLILARDLFFMPETLFDPLYQLSTEVHKLLNGLIKSVKGSTL